MYEAIKNFPSQFAFSPHIVNGEKLARYKHFIVAGMGGSGLAARLIGAWNPALDVRLHQDYGLPMIPDDAFVIVSSYSGDTEEVLDVFHTALEKNVPCGVIAAGGKLLAEAQEKKIPFIKLLDKGIQPRSARGYSFVALLSMLGEETALADIAGLSSSLNALEYEHSGKDLAERLRGFIPIIYASGRNEALAYNWKIAFNETGKIPAFSNVFPELNHNEIEGFDDKTLTQSFKVIFLHDSSDHPKIQKRMSVLEKMFRDRALRVESVEMSGKDIFHKMFSTLLIGDWAAYYTARLYGHEPEKTAVVEDFKRLL